jgi:hypothetical protein
MGGFARWTDDQDTRLKRKCAETLDRIVRLDLLTADIVSLSERDEPLWMAVIEGLAMSCHNTARTLGGESGRCAWAKVPLPWQHRPFKRLKDVLVVALDGANLGLGAARPGSSGINLDSGQPHGLKRTELVIDVQTAVREAGLSDEDLGMLVASRVGYAGVDLRRKHVRVRMRNYEIARALELSTGVVRRRLASADERLSKALVARGLLEERLDGKRDNQRVAAHRQPPRNQ